MHSRPITLARLLFGAGSTLASFTLGLGCGSADTGEVRLGVAAAKLQTSDQIQLDQAKTDAGLALTRVRLLVNVVKVGYTGGPDASGDEASVGPIAVELTGDEIKSGAARSFSLGELDTGTYGGAEIEIDTLDDGFDASGDESLTDFADEGASVPIDGTYQGAEFHFAAHFLAEQGTDDEVTIDAATPFDLDLTVEPSGWFVDADGAVLDPTDASAHDAIALAICKSLDTQPQLGGRGGGPEAHCVVTP